MPYMRPTKLVQWTNRALGWLASFGLSPSDTVTLEVRGRRSGEVRANPVIWIDVDGQHYLVSTRGESEWVRNVRAANGEAVLRRRGRRPVRLEELPPAESAPVLKAYLQKTQWETKRYFSVAPDAPVEEFARIAPDHPVFRVVETQR
jgi:deazaflavin-dependent oxidoreductase (nitroreductase family)